jgi:hypothetical protein
MHARAIGAWEAAKAPGARPERSEYNHRLPTLPLTLIHQVASQENSRKSAQPRSTTYERP